MEAYRAAGGCASIFVNDDGLQLLGEEARLCRIRCAGPAHKESLPCWRTELAG